MRRSGWMGHSVALHSNITQPYAPKIDSLEFFSMAIILPVPTQNFARGVLMWHAYWEIKGLKEVYSK